MIIIDNITKINKEARDNISQPSTQNVIEEISNNFNALYYLSFEPQALAVQQNEPNKTRLKTRISSRSFSDMIFDEILNDLSNILINDMQGITNEDMASLNIYVSEIIMPSFITKFMALQH